MKLKEKQLRGVVREAIKGILLREWNGDDYIRYREENGIGDEVSDEELEDMFVNDYANSCDREYDRTSLKEGDIDIDNDSYYGGGLPDSDYQYPGQEAPDVDNDDSDVYVVVNSKTNDIEAICRNRKNAAKIANQKGIQYHFIGYHFSD